MLSISELEKYFSDNEARLCKGTEYCLAHLPDNFKYSDGNCDWWLRSPGLDDDFAAFVYGKHGDVIGGGSNVDLVFGVRPALWINLES